MSSLLPFFSESVSLPYLNPAEWFRQGRWGWPFSPFGMVPHQGTQQNVGQVLGLFLQVVEQLLAL